MNEENPSCKKCISWMSAKKQGKKRWCVNTSEFTPEDHCCKSFIQKKQKKKENANG